MTDRVSPRTEAIDTSVLIVGAGPSGLTMAVELARRGVACRVVDIARSATDKSKALGVQARTLEAFENMGVDSLVERGNPCTAANLYHDRDQLVHIDFSELDTPFPFLLIVAQAETEHALITRLESLGVQVERETRFLGMEQDDRGATATLQRPDGTEETLRCAYVVGCDGAHSAVRHALGLPFAGEEYPEGFLLADVRVAWPRSPRELHAFIHDGRILGVIPLPDGYWRLIADVPPEEAPLGGEPSLELLRALVRERADPEAMVSDPIWTANYRLHRRIVSRMQQGRAFLVGDSAHIHNPVGGQGMNTGIQDAFNLGWKLALVLQGAADSTLLESYHAERYPVEQAVLTGTDLVLKVATLRQPIAQAARDRLASALTGLEPVRQRIRGAVSELAIRYPHSPIVENHFIGGGPVAGDRAPDAQLRTQAGEGTRLFLEMRGTGHHLLLFSGTEEQSSDLEALQRLALRVWEAYTDEIATHLLLAAGDPLPGWSGSVLLDPDGLGQARYGVQRPALFLIRPDRYIGYRALVREASRTFPRYLEKLFSRSLAQG